MTNKKTLIVLSIIIFVVLGFSLTPRLYSLYTINKVIEQQGGKEQINHLKERSIDVSNVFSDRVTDVVLNFVKLKTPLGYKKYQDDFQVSANSYMYYLEDEHDYKSIIITDKFNYPSVIDSLKNYIDGQNKTLIGIDNFRSDFELTTFFFELQPDNLSLLSTLDDIQIAMASMVFRTIYIPFHGGLYKFSLGNKYRGLQFGEANLNHIVRVNVYDSHKLLIELAFNGLTQQEIDFVLSTLEVTNRTDL